MNRLFKFTWRTNYGERVAIVEAVSEVNAILLFKPGVLWEGFEIEELTVTGTPRIISIDGGD